MQIKIFHNTEGAKNAEGLAVVIDVFRAFTTECYAIAAGAKMIIPVGDLAAAYELKSRNPAYILMGEQQGEIPKGFDYGNSPFQISQLGLRDKTIVHVSTAGTKGMANAKKANEIVSGSFVNADAIVKYIRLRNPAILSLVCTGTDNETISDEDALCAKYIQDTLLGNPVNFPDMVSQIKSGGYIDRFLDPNIPKYPIEDVDYCLALNKFDFVLKATPYQNDLLQLSRIDL